MTAPRITKAGVLIGGGFVVGLAYGFVTIPPFGIIRWLAFVALAAGVVCVSLVLRLTEALVRPLHLAVNEGAS